jgi:four helix bundle protein
MLRIYPVLLELVQVLKPARDALERHDPDLARQYRRALASAALNVGEGSGSRGKNRVVRYHSALGSMREVLVSLEFAAAMGYMAPVEPAVRARFDHVIGTLVRLVVLR